MKTSDLRSITLTSILFAALPLLVTAQQSPFGNPQSAEDPFADPFAAPTSGQDAPSPFGDNSPPAVQPSAPASPFGNPNQAQPAAPANPFGSPSQATPSPSNVSDPFASPAPQNNQAAPVSPFGNPNQAQPTAPASPFGNASQSAPSPSNVSDPFAAPAQNNQATPASPFGSPNQVQPSAPASPFGSSAPQASSQSNVQDPFSSPQVTTSNNAPASPFGSSQSASNDAPASPFGSSSSTQASSDPFSGGATSGSDIASPFGSSSSPASSGSGSASSFNPFETEAPSTTVGSISSPFGDSAQPTTSSSPFNVAGGASSSPFTTQPTATGDVNREGIGQLYAFRYEVVTRWDQTQVVARKRLAYDKADEYDTAAIQLYVDQIQAGEILGYDPAQPAQLWAEWIHYSDQLELWGYYVDNIVLAGTDPDTVTYDTINWPAAQAGEGEGGNDQFGPTTGTESVVNYASSTSLDDQLDDLVNPFGGGNQQQTAQLLYGPETIEDQVVATYNIRFQQLRQLEQDQEQAYTEFLDRLAERKSRRLAYADWRNDQERQIEDAVIDWNRRYNGSVANIGGVRYELYRPGHVPENVQRDSVVVVTDFDLTPYDILNPEDGTLK